MSILDRFTLRGILAYTNSLAFRLQSCTSVNLIGTVNMVDSTLQTPFVLNIHLGMTELLVLQVSNFHPPRALEENRLLDLQNLDLEWHKTYSNPIYRSI